MIILLLDLVLLAEQVLLNLVDPDVEPLNIHLGLLPPVLRPLELVEQLQDVVLRPLLPLDRLLLPHLQQLEVGAHHPQLLLNVLDLLLGPLGPLVPPRTVGLERRKFSGDVVELVFRVGESDLGLGQLLVQAVDALLVAGDPVLQLRPLPDVGVGSEAGTGQLQGGLGEGSETWQRNTFSLD